MTTIHTFLYDTDFINQSLIFDPVIKTGGVCVLSPQTQSYFVSPQEIRDQRTTRAANLNLPLQAGADRLIVDQTIYPELLTDVSSVWSTTEQQNLFAIIDELVFAYNANMTSTQVEAAMTAWSQYVVNTHVFPNTTSSAIAFSLSSSSSITVPDSVEFSFQIASGTVYDIKVWLNNTLFSSNYPNSTIAVVVPPVPAATLYNTPIVGGIDNIFTTALASAKESQQILSSYIQSGEYSGYFPQDVAFQDVNGNVATVQFNLLYQGTSPGVIAVRTAIRNFLLNSGVGNAAGWQAKAPSLFVVVLFYLLPLWDNATVLLDQTVYVNIVPNAKASTDATKFLYDVQPGWINANYEIGTSFYNNLSFVAVPDTENDPTRLSLKNEHPTYTDLTSSQPNFNLMKPNDQTFSSLLAGALSVAAGNASTNQLLSTYSPPADNRTYVIFSVADVEYYLATQNTYLALVNPA